ncbi:MAG: tyrosine-type recombinase/integrase, partial [Pseudonocardiaceae bacterium]
MGGGFARAPSVFAELRLGELLAWRWRAVDWSGSALTISRSLSSGVEGTTKTGRVRRVPMADQAAATLDRLSQRQDFISPDDYVFCNAQGRLCALDPALGMGRDSVPKDGGRVNEPVIDRSGAASGPFPRTGRRSSRTEQRDCGELLCWVVTYPPTDTLEAGSSSARCELLREAVVAVRAKLCSDAVSERLPCAG